MSCNLAKQVVEIFIDIVEKTSTKTGIVWDKCKIKIVARYAVDRYIIEVYIYDPCSCEKVLDVFQVPTVVIDYTDIDSDSIESKCWLTYLEKKACKLLDAFEDLNGNLIRYNCCVPDVCDAPVNKCNCTYRQEFVLDCCKDKCRDKCKDKCKDECGDKPYSDWNKHCCKPKIKCCPYIEPECPLVFPKKCCKPKYVFDDCNNSPMDYDKCKYPNSKCSEGDWQISGKCRSEKSCKPNPCKPKCHSNKCKPVCSKC